MAFSCLCHIWELMVFEILSATELIRMREEGVLTIGGLGDTWADELERNKIN